MKFGNHLFIKSIKENKQENLLVLVSDSNECTCTSSWITTNDTFLKSFVENYTGPYYMQLILIDIPECINIKRRYDSMRLDPILYFYNVDYFSICCVIFATFHLKRTVSVDLLIPHINVIWHLKQSLLFHM